MKDLVREYHKYYKHDDMTLATLYVPKYVKHITTFYYNRRRIDGSLRFYSPYIYNPKKYKKNASFIAIADIPNKYY